MKVQCLNCELPIDSYAVFCQHCGQKNQTSKITIRQVFGDFIDNFFNFDNRLWVTVRDVLIPGRLTREYVLGHRKKYMNPLRLFLIAAIINIAGINFALKGKLEDVSMGSNVNLKEIRVQDKLIQNLKKERDSLAVKHPQLSPTLLDSAIRKLSLKYEVPYDTIQIAGNNDGNQNIIIKEDSLDLGEKGPGIFLEDFKISRRDFVEKSADEIIETYNVTNYWKKIGIKQTLKLLNDGVSQMVRFIIGNIIWVVLITLPLMAFIMKLLYIRRRHYFVEHLIFQVHLHSVAFLFSAIGYYMINKFGGGPIAMAFILIFFFYFAAVKLYYKQGFFKTVIKTFVMMLSYFTLMCIMAVVSLVVGMILF